MHRLQNRIDKLDGGEPFNEIDNLSEEEVDARMLEIRKELLSFGLTRKDFDEIQHLVLAKERYVSRQPGPSAREVLAAKLDAIAAKRRANQ